MVAEDVIQAERKIIDADAAYGTLPAGEFERAAKLRWLQAPAAVSPAGYYTRELGEHPLTVMNFRGIYNDHIVAFVLAENCRRFAKGEPLLNVVDKGKWF